MRQESHGTATKVALQNGLPKALDGWQLRFQTRFLTYHILMIFPSLCIVLRNEKSPRYLLLLAPSGLEAWANLG